MEPNDQILDNEPENELDHETDAPPVKRPGPLVLMAGVVTSAVTLGSMFVLSWVFPDFQIMGWYANYVIPVGAMLVGLVAGSGYGLASWLTGAKIGKGLMIQIILLQICVYLFAQYVEYSVFKLAVPDLGMSFWQYFDSITQAWAWDDNGKPGEPFGLWGYGMRALELSGFSLCALVAPAILFAVPYCEKCQIYMSTKELGLLPCGIEPRKIKKKDLAAQQAYELDAKTAMEAGLERMKSAVESIEQKDAQRFADILKEHAGSKKELVKHTSRLVLSLQHCGRCNNGRVIINLQVGHGQEMSTNELGRADVDAEFVRGVMMYREG